MLLVEQKLQALFHTIIMIPSQVLFQSNWANLDLDSKNKKASPYTYHTQSLLLVIWPYFQNTEWSTLNIGIFITLYFLHLSLDWFPDLISSFQSMASMWGRSFCVWKKPFTQETIPPPSFSEEILKQNRYDIPISLPDLMFLYLCLCSWDSVSINASFSD